MNVALSLANLVHYLAIALYILILARVLLSWFPISPWHPLVRVLRAIVDPILRPFRRLLPTLGGIDLSPLVAILIIFFLARVLEQALLYVAIPGGQINLGAEIVLLIAQLLENIIIVLGVLVLIRLLLSVFSADPWHPLVMGIRTMTNPLVRPFAGFGRRGQHTGVDVPALIALVAYVILYVIVAVLVGNLLVRAF